VARFEEGRRSQSSAVSTFPQHVGPHRTRVVRPAGKTYKVTQPKDIPAGKFWSFTVYDNQTRSMFQTPQRFPRAGSQTYPTKAAMADSNGATTIYLAIMPDLTTLSSSPA
jgi:uncharacterized protein DUF1214